MDISGLMSGEATPAFDATVKALGGYPQLSTPKQPQVSASKRNAIKRIQTRIMTEAVERTVS